MPACRPHRFRFTFQSCRCLALTVAMGTWVPSVSAQEPFYTQTTCHPIGGLENCPSATLWLEDWTDWGYGPVLSAGFGGWNLPSTILPTAFAFYAKPDAGYGFDALIGLGGWTGSIPSSWTVGPTSRQMAHPALAGYYLMAGLAIERGPDHWWAALEGTAGDANIWRWDGGQIPSDFRWVWRGESEDGSIKIDCFQGPAGGSDCLSSVPEPSTMVLLLTGFLAFAAVALARRRRNASQGRAA